MDNGYLDFDEDVFFPISLEVYEETTSTEHWKFEGEGGVSTLLWEGQASSYCGSITFMSSDGGDWR